MMNIRIGFGYDIHPLKKGRKLFLGGLKIPSSIGLEGHSDADVVLHALCDAILGALSFGDIGEQFPDTSEKTKNMRSTHMVEKIKKLRIFNVVNVDITVVTETPILSPYKKDIENSIAKLLEIDRGKVSVKAKRNEGFGMVGEKQAVVCFAAILLEVR